MANPLKVLTQLTASKEAQFQEVVEAQKTVTISGAEAHLRVTGGGEISGSAALKAGGAAQLGSTLDVKGAAALSSSLGVVGAANLQSTLAVADVASFASDISASAGMDIGGALHVVGAADLDSNLDVAGYAKVIGEISGSDALNIGGASHLKGAAQLDSTLTVAADVTMQASASVAGDLSVAGDGNVENFVVRGNLIVQGNTTSIETQDLFVKDKNIIIASASMPTDFSADGAGITVMGTTQKSFNWVDATDAWTSSENMDLAAGKVYEINGEEVLSKDTIFAKLSKNGSSDAFVRTSATAVEIHSTEGVDLDNELRVSGDVKISGGSKLKIAGYEALANNGSATVMSLDAGAASVSVSSNSVSIAGNLDIVNDLHLSGALSVDGVSTFASDVTASANVNVAGDIALAGSSRITMNGDRKLFITDMNDYQSGEAYGPGDLRLQQSSSYGWSRLTLQDGFTQLEASSGLEIKAPNAVYISGAFHVANDAAFDGALNVTGTTTLVSDVTASANVDIAGNAHVAGGMSVDGVASFVSDVTASANVDIVGTLHVVDAVDFDSTLNVDGATTMNNMLTVNSNISASGELQVGDMASFNSWVAVEGDLIANSKLKISGSSEFINIGPLLVNGRYEVDEAIHALDALVGNQGSNINNAYNALRYLSAANFDAQGMASFTSSFAAAAIEQVSVDVLVQAGGSGPWTNDLVSVQVKAAGAYVGFEISAPAMGASDKVRIIAVKESGSLA